MTKIETKLKQQGWKIDIFQPKGEPYPWAMKISKKVNTKGLHSDSVTDWIRQCRGYYVITAYLNPTGKLSEKEKEERITSSIRWELTKQYDKLHKYDYLQKLTDIVGEVHPLVFKRRVKNAYVENSNEKAFGEEKDIKSKKAVAQLKLTDSKQEPVKKKENVTPPKKSVKKSGEKITSKKKSAEQSLNTKNGVSKTEKKLTTSTTKKTSSVKKKTSEVNKPPKQTKATTKKVVVQKTTKPTSRKTAKLTTSTKKKIS